MNATLLADRRGASKTEYIILLGLVALLVLAGFKILGGKATSTVDEEGRHVQNLEGWNGHAGGSGKLVMADGEMPKPNGASRSGRVSGLGDPGLLATNDCAGGVCKGNNNCFVAGTPVATLAGLRAIETVREGDVVLGADASGEVAGHRVVKTFVSLDRAVARVEIEKDGLVETLGVTPEHRVWIDGEGWTPIAEVTPGAEGVASDGRRVVFRSLASAGERADVYNFEVEDAHDYFVGEAEALVHNDCVDDAEKGDLTDPKTRNAIEQIGDHGPYDYRTYKILANAVFGERNAKDAYEQAQWKLHEARQIPFDTYWDRRKKAEKEDWFPNAWGGLRQGLFENNPAAVSAVKDLIARAKASGVDPSFGGEKMREAQRLIDRNAPTKSVGNPGDKFPVPDLPKAARDQLDVDQLLGLADKWMKMNDDERNVTNRALDQLDDKSKVKFVKDFANDEIDARRRNQPPKPGEAWMEGFPPPLVRGIKKLGPATQGAMEAKWNAIEGRDARAIISEQIDGLERGASGEALARTMFNRLYPSNDSLNKWRRFELQFRDSGMSYPAYVELSCKVVPAIAKKEQKQAANQEQQRKNEFIARLQKLMADPGLKKRADRDGKFLEVANRNALEHTGHTLLGFGKQGVDTVVGIGHIVIHPVDTAKGLWFAVTNPDKSIPALLVSIDESYHDDPDQFMGRVLFEVTLAAATAGGGEGVDGAAKARQFATAATKAREAGELAKAIRYAEAAEKMAVKAEKVAKKAGDVGEAARIAAEARNAANAADKVAGAAKADLVTRAERLIKLSEESFPRYAKELEPAKDAVKKALGDFGEVQARAKDPVSAANRLERAIDRFHKTVTTVDEVMANLWDAIGTRVVLKDTSPAAVDKLVDKLALSIKSGELKVVEINNLHGPGGKPYFSAEHIEKLQQAAAASGKTIKINSSKVMESGYTVVCVYLEHGNGVLGELQIIGSKTLELANVEHIPYDISLGKPLVRAIDPKAVPEMQRIVGPVEDATRAFTKEHWDKYNAYLNESYIQARNAELGLPTKPTKLPEGIPDVLGVENLKKIDADIKALKAKYPGEIGATPTSRLLQAHPPDALHAAEGGKMPKILAQNLTAGESAEIAGYAKDLQRVAEGIEKNPLNAARELSELKWPKVKVSWDKPIEMGESTFPRLAEEAEKLAKEAGVTKAEALEYLIDERFNQMLSTRQAYYYDPKSGLTHVPRDFVVYKDGKYRPLNVSDPIEKAFAERHARCLVEEFSHGAGSGVRAGEYVPLSPKMYGFQKWLAEADTQAWLKTKYTAEEIADMKGHIHEADITELLRGRSPHGDAELGRYKIREAYEEYVKRGAK